MRPAKGTLVAAAYPLAVGGPGLEHETIASLRKLALARVRSYALTSAGIALLPMRARNDLGAIPLLDRMTRDVSRIFGMTDLPPLRAEPRRTRQAESARRLAREVSGFLSKRGASLAAGWLATASARKAVRRAAWIRPLPFVLVSATSAAVAYGTTLRHGLSVVEACHRDVLRRARVARGVA